MLQTLELEVARELEAAGVETRTVKRCEYNDEVVRWFLFKLVICSSSNFVLLKECLKVESWLKIYYSN